MTIVLREDVRLVVLPKCSRCELLAPECKCGYQIWKKEGGDD